MFVCGSNLNLELYLFRLKIIVRSMNEAELM